MEDYQSAYTGKQIDEAVAKTTALMESINDKADKVNTYTKAETDTAIQTAINGAILTALNTAV